MGSKMLTEHAQIHAESVKVVKKSENPNGKGKLGNGKIIVEK